MDYVEWLKRKKRKEEEEWYRKLIAYFMMKKYYVQQEAIQNQYTMEIGDMLLTMARDLWKAGIFRSLFVKRNDELSPVELLDHLEPKEGNAYFTLLREMKRQPHDARKLNMAITRVVVETPPRLIRREAEERRRREEWHRKNPHKRYELVKDERARLYEERLECEMVLLRMMMPPELYQKLCKEMEKQGRQFDMEKDFLRVPDKKKELWEKAKQAKEKEKQEAEHRYRKYTEEKKTDPKEKAGKLINSSDVFAAAAYMLAAYEQKGAATFDEKKADARAMEISGSRAFRAYMKGHPGNLMAAARNIGVEEARDGIEALSQDLDRRDAILVEARDSLKRMSTGKTECFHQMLNMLNRYVDSDVEPTEQERSSLVTALGNYITTDCAPGSREMDRACFGHAMRSVRALLSERDFGTVIEKVNEGRYPKVKATDFDLPEAEPEAPRRAGSELILMPTD